MMTAYELQKEHLNVAIIDKGHLGGEASSAGGGILSSLTPWTEPEPAQQLYQWSQQQYPLLCEQLLNETAIDPEYLLSGMVVLHPPLDDSLRNWLAQQGDQAELLSQTDSVKILSQAESEIVWLANIAQVNPTKLIDALQQYLQQQGVEILEKNPARQMVVEDEKVVRIMTPREDLVAEHYVLAAGAWSGQDSFNANIIMKPVRGQMIRYDLADSLTDRILLDQRRYCIPRANNGLVVGSTLEDVGFDASTTETAKQQLMEFAESLFPELTGISPDAHWAGLRPDCSRDRPIIGQHAQIENLFINTGHFRNGILAAPASARVVTELVLRKQTIVDTTAFAHVIP